MPLISEDEIDRLAELVTDETTREHEAPMDLLWVRLFGEEDTATPAKVVYLCTVIGRMGDLFTSSEMLPRLRAGELTPDDLDRYRATQTMLPFLYGVLLGLRMLDELELVYRGKLRNE
jgi:hypothetical protein